MISLRRQQCMNWVVVHRSMRKISYKPTPMSFRFRNTSFTIYTLPTVPQTLKWVTSQLIFFSDILSPVPAKQWQTSDFLVKITIKSLIWSFKYQLQERISHQQVMWLEPMPSIYGITHSSNYTMANILAHGVVSIPWATIQAISQLLDVLWPLHSPLITN